MARPCSGAEVIHDTSYSCYRRANSRAPTNERRNFMSPNLADMYTEPISKESANELDLEDEEMDIRKLFKDIEYLASSHRSWKERKELENRNVVALGGKPPKKQRLPLSVAKVPMKKQKQREQKKLEEEIVKYGKHSVNNNREEKRKPEDRVLKASQGHFKKGVLNVKHLLGPTSSSKGNDLPIHKTSMGKKKGKGKGKGRKGKGKKGKGMKKRS